MKPVFCILATLALTATTDADVLEYNEANFKSSYLADRWINHITAELINSQYGVEFQPDDSILPDSAFFVLTSTPDSTSLTLAQPDPDCGYYLGVRLLGFNELYYNVTLFRVLSASLPGRIPAIYLVFDSDRTPPFQLVVPIFKLAEKHASKKPNELMTWGEENHVETVSPLTQGHLEQLERSNRPVIKIKFDWLKRLLSYGLHIHREPVYSLDNTPMKTYTTRALVLPLRFIQHCDRVLARFRQTPSFE